MAKLLWVTCIALALVGGETSDATSDNTDMLQVGPSQNKSDLPPRVENPGHRYESSYCYHLRASCKAGLALIETDEEQPKHHAGKPRARGPNTRQPGSEPNSCGRYCEYCYKNPYYELPTSHHDAAAKRAQALDADYERKRDQRKAARDMKKDRRGTRRAKAESEWEEVAAKRTAIRDWYADKREDNREYRRADREHHAAERFERSAAISEYYNDRAEAAHSRRQAMRLMQAGDQENEADQDYEDEEEYEENADEICGGGEGSWVEDFAAAGTSDQWDVPTAPPPELPGTGMFGHNHR